MSAVFPKPSFQKELTPDDSARDVPDVAYGASPQSPGFFFGDDFGGNPILEVIGGTSVAAPMWAGLSRLVAQTSRTPGCDSCPNPRLGNMDPKSISSGQSPTSLLRVCATLSPVTILSTALPVFPRGPARNQTTGWGTADMATFVSAYTSGPVSTTTPQRLAVVKCNAQALFERDRYLQRLPDSIFERESDC